jgi:hypothetical protein
VTVAAATVPEVTGAAISTASIQASPIERGASGSTETGIRSAARWVIAEPVSPAVGCPSLNSTSRGTCSGASSPRAAYSAASRSVAPPSGPPCGEGWAARVLASCRSASVLASVTALRPKATIRECDGASARFSSSIFAAV